MRTSQQTINKYMWMGL